jgi:hypothetical protein
MPRSGSTRPKVEDTAAQAARELSDAIERRAGPAAHASNTMDKESAAARPGN